MDAYLNEVVRYLAAQSWQIAVLTVAVATVTFALRHRSAHVRYLLWLIVVAKCLVPPLYMAPLRVLPPTMRAGIPSMLSQPAWRPDRPIIVNPVPLDTRRPEQESAPRSMAPQVSAHRLSVSGWLGGFWIAGAGAYLMMNLLRAVRGHHWLRRTRRPLPDNIQSDTANLLLAYGARRLPRIWMMEGVGQPFVWGLLRGSIYVPPGFLTIECPAHRRDILAHELSHVLRFDAAVNVLQVIAQALFWFHPLVWWANHKIRCEREKCCDEMAIAQLGAGPKDYSTALVSTLIAAQESTRAVPSLAIAGPVKNIEERIKAMLRPGKRFYKRPSLIAATAVLLAAFLTVPTAIVLTARGQAEAPKPPAKSTPPLHDAALAWDIEKIKSLLSQGVDVNARDNLGRTALHCACAKPDDPSEEIARLLITRGADVNARDNNGNTPLHIAAREWGIQKDLLDLLIAKGADVNARDDDGQTPLHLASPANLEVPTAERERRNKVVAANALVSNGAQINARDKNGCTPLYVASGNGRRDVVELLLAKGAAINEKTNDGLTSLHRAAMLGRTETATVLMQWLGRENPALDLKDGQGCTPLHYASMAGANDIVELLIFNDADVNPKNAHGETPAYLAVLHNHKDTVKLLLSTGVEVSTIQLAAYTGDLAKVRSFIEKGVSVSAQEGYPLTPLHAAAATGQREVVEFLIAKRGLRQRRSRP